MRRTLTRRQPRVQTLEIFKREAAQIGAEGGEVPAVGEDPEARGMDKLSEGDTLEGHDWPSSAVVELRHTAGGQVGRPAAPVLAGRGG